MVAHKPYNVNRFIEKSSPKVFPCRGAASPTPRSVKKRPRPDAGGIFSAPNFHFLPNFPVFIPGNRKNM